MNVIKKIYILVFLMVFSPIFSEAGWFSKPKNFDECVLEKMKGQDKSMRPYAVRACRKLFPEVRLSVSEIENIEMSWKSDDSSISLMIDRNDSNYQITKCEASFSVKTSDEIDNEIDKEIKKRGLQPIVVKLNDGSESKLFYAEEYKIIEDTKAKFYTLTKTFIFKKGKAKSNDIKIDKADQYKSMKTLSLWGIKSTL